MDLHSLLSMNWKSQLLRLFDKDIFVHRHKCLVPILCCCRYTIPVKTTKTKLNQRTIGPENAHLKPDLGVLSHNEMSLSMGKGTSWSQNLKFSFLHKTVVKYHKINF